MEEKTCIFWFRRDLRYEDNCGLFHALLENQGVVGLFIFDTTILGPLERDDSRVGFIHERLSVINHEFQKHGSALMVLHGDPVELFRSLPAVAVYTNEDYEPHAHHRDDKVAEILAARGIKFKSFKDQVIFSKDEVVKSDGDPYTVFTPYSRRWKQTLADEPPARYPSETILDRLASRPAEEIPALESFGFSTNSSIKIPPAEIDTTLISNYERHRDYPSITGTSRLGIHLRFGTISIRKAVAIAMEFSSAWLNELIWREFAQMILWHYPHVAKGSFRPAFDHIAWQNDEQMFQRWCDGMTGYPLVDAGMRQLNNTGFMHNRVRMVVASFLAKHLLIDWRWGEAYFAARLLDYDLAANNAGWQWAAGSGCDAAPYFRIFNPARQAERFDPDGDYIRQWVKEFGSARYPAPIVDHVAARNRAVAVYGKALSAQRHLV